MKITKSKLRKIIKEEIELESLRNNIRKMVRELDFKSKEAYKKYQSQHKVKPGTRVNIGGEVFTTGRPMSSEPEVDTRRPEDAASGDKDSVRKPDPGFEDSSSPYSGQDHDNFNKMLAKHAKKSKDDKHWGPIYDKLSKSTDWEDVLEMLDDSFHTKSDVEQMLDDIGADQTTIDVVTDMSEFHHMERG
jgi:hypothetical protein